MTESLRREAYRIFDEALALEPPARSAHLAKACGSNAALFAEVRALMEADEGASLDTAGLRNLGHTSQPDLSGRVIGHFRLLERIGGGGMGVVYRGERTDQIGQRVAVKIVRQELRGPMSRARFDIERVSLARLEHPAIARLIDAGLTEDNLPWYAMEYVDGEPIDRYCDERTLGIEPRLQLMIELCGAVDAAHQALIVHRDIKPGNVLVTAAGQPKLIDFGISKHMGAGDTDLTRNTGTLFTSHFAAPEQVMGQEIGTTADVFGLGALAYRLLTGQRIFADSVRNDYDYLQAVTQREVELASRVSGNRALRGDLDKILRKALARDPRQRYPSAAELGAEFLRHIKHLPIRAQAPGLGYRVGKFVQRNRMAVALGVLLAGASSIGAYSYISQSRAVELQRDVARREAMRSKQINGFLTSMLESADPRLGTRDVTVVEALDRAIVRVDATLGNDPGLAGDVLMTIAGSNGSMSRFDVAAETAQRAATYFQRDPARAVDAAAALADRGEWLELNGDAAAAEATLRAAVATLQRIAPGSVALAEAQRQLATVLTNAGKMEEAEALFRAALASLRQRDMRDMALARTVNDYAVMLGSSGRAREALPLHREALALAIGAVGADSPFVDDVRSGLAGALGFTNQSAESLALFRQIADRRARVLGPMHLDTLWSQAAIASALNDLGRPAEALPLAVSTERALQQTVGQQHQVTLYARGNLGRAQCGAGQADAGARTLADVAATRAKVYGDQHWLVANSRVLLARCLIGAGRLDEAERWLLPAIARLETTQGAAFSRTQEAYADAARLYEVRGNTGVAAQWRARLTPQATSTP